MIRVEKPTDPPEVLRAKGKNKRRGMSSAYSRARADYRSGAKTFEFDSKIYGHKDVKSVLITAQHDKCVFCESKVTHIAYGDVEHFRPKAGYRQQRSDDLGRPGYYWLAYEWDNLFFACQLCNQRYKRNLFPLSDPAGRALDHKHDIEDEDPLFIDPATTDPEEHISFRAEIAFPVDGSPLGHATLDSIGLNREELVEVRLDWIQKLSLIHALATADPAEPETERARKHLARAVQPASQYSAMARAALQAWGYEP